MYKAYKFRMYPNDKQIALSIILKLFKKLIAPKLCISDFNQQKIDFYDKKRHIP